MHEVEMLTVEASEETVSFRKLDLVPANMGQTQSSSLVGEPTDVAGDPAKALMFAELLAALCHHLHADADAEDRGPLSQNALSERRLKVTLAQHPQGFADRADAG